MLQAHTSILTEEYFMLQKVKVLLDQLKLRGIVDVIDNTIANAEQNSPGISEVLYTIFQAEYQHQKERTLQNRLKLAKMPWDWTLDTFPFKEQPSVNKSQIMELAQLRFMERVENIIFMGETGTGKSGLAIGLLRTAILNGYRGRFYNAQDLLDELYTSMADRTTTKLFNQLNNYDILLIDELGYLNLNPEQINMFFKLIEMRYRKKPTIVTTNLLFNEWYAVFKDKALVDAMLDRFRHYCIPIHIEGESLRKPTHKLPSTLKKNTEKKQDNATATE